MMMVVPDGVVVVAGGFVGCGCFSEVAVRLPGLGVLALQPWRRHMTKQLPHLAPAGREGKGGREGERGKGREDGRGWFCVVLHTCMYQFLVLMYTEAALSQH